MQGNTAGKTGKQSGNNPPKAPRPKKGGGKAKNRVTANTGKHQNSGEEANSGKRPNKSPSKRPSVELDDVAVVAVNGLEH